MPPALGSAAVTPEDLVEIEAIKRLKYRYVRLLDLKEWDELAELFVADATASYGGGQYSFEGREEIMAFLRRTMERTSMLTSHKVHQPEIELTGPDSATGTWALDDVVNHTELGVTIRGPPSTATSTSRSTGPGASATPATSGSTKSCSPVL